MSRRLFLLLITSSVARLVADASGQVYELLTSMASALSGGNPVGFLRGIDPSMKGYQELQQSVVALTRMADVLCSIEVLRERGDDSRRYAELDWFLQIEEKASGSVVRRRQIVKCHFERKGKDWRITSLEPLSLFAAPEIQ